MRKNIRLVSILEPMVGSDFPEDMVVEHLLVGMNAFYSHNLPREIRKELKERALFSKVQQKLENFQNSYADRTEHSIF